MIGVAVASQDLKIVILSQENTIKPCPNEELSQVSEVSDVADIDEVTEADQGQNTDDDDDAVNGEEGKPIKVPYSREGFNQILEVAGTDNVVLIAGNKQWALPLAYALQAEGREVRYLAGPKRSRGAKEKWDSVLKKALEKGFSGRPFFLKRASFEIHPDVKLGNDYFLLMNEVRRVKHRVINNLRLILPELLQLGDKLWKTIGRKESLSRLDWQTLSEEIGVSLQDSLAFSVPEEKRIEANEHFRELMAELSGLEGRAERLQRRVVNKTKNHPIVKFIGGSGFSPHLLALFLGWRKWGTSRKVGFRQLRHFVGLDVSVMDGKGKMRISRSRPNVRTAVYWALLTSVGKEIAETKGGSLKLGGRPKRLERLLLAIWRNCLKEKTPVAA